MVLQNSILFSNKTIQRVSYDQNAFFKHFQIFSASRNWNYEKIHLETKFTHSNKCDFTTMAEPFETSPPGNPGKLGYRVLSWYTDPVINPVAFWIRYLSHVFPDPGKDQRPVTGPGGSWSFRWEPKHHLFSSNGFKASWKSFWQNDPFEFSAKLKLKYFVKIHEREHWVPYICI